MVDFDHMRAAERISNFCEKKPKEIFDLFFVSEATVLFEEGKISPKDFFERVQNTIGCKLEYESFVNIWNDIFFLSAKNRAVYSLANHLRANYKVVLLSNVNLLHYEYLKKHFPVFNVFHQVFTSFELGVVKPNHAIYKKVLETLNVPAQDVFYTDDRQELIDSAKELGINSFLFTGIDKLKNDLVSVGVEI